MAWEIEYADEFGKWWDGLSMEEQEKVDAKVGLLIARGPALGRPHADTIKGSRHQNMKELVLQYSGRPYRVFYAFDPRRCATLLIGGVKTEEKRFYEEFIPLADRLYDQHLATLREEGLIDG
mgnify:CR=1 FL=1|jgi:hypothetical protein